MPRDMLQVLERFQHRRAATSDSTPLQDVKRYRDTDPGRLTTSRLDLRSTHHPAVGAKRVGRCFRAILRKVTGWRKRLDSSPPFPAALRAVAPILAAQAFGLALSLGDAADRRPAQGLRQPTKPRYVLARYESLVLCWPRTIDNRLRLLLQ